MDLSQHHAPISGLFDAPPDPASEDKYALTPEQVAHFHEKGYVAGVPILTNAQCDALCAELAELTDPTHPGNGLFYEYNSNESADPSTVLFHALGAWRVTPGFHDILWNPTFTIPASQLLGGAVRFWHDQLFCKPAHHGGVVAWHQDYSYWTRTQPMNHLTNPPRKTAACNTFPKATPGPCSPSLVWQETWRRYKPSSPPNKRPPSTPSPFPSPEDTPPSTTRC